MPIAPQISSLHRKRSQIHQHRPRGVGDIGDVAPSGQVPHDPRIDGAEAELAVLGPGPQTRVVFEEPGNLGTGEVGGQRQTGLRSKAVDAVGATEALAELGGAGVLPDDGVVKPAGRSSGPRSRWSRAGW